jgi:hypothetical protein
MDHLVSWPQSMGGAGITPGLGQWKNVKAIFPMHNEKVNQAFLRRLSKKLLLGIDDLDKIRDLFGSKVCDSSSDPCIRPQFLEVNFSNNVFPSARLHSILRLASPIRPFSYFRQLLALSPGCGCPTTRLPTRY